MEHRPLNAPRLFDGAASEEGAHPLTEPSLFYDPPYERPLEDEFAWHLVKYLNPISGLLYQAPAQTPGGTFWVDFVVECGAASEPVRRIGFEIGDLEPATPDDEGERLRDALLIGTGALDVLYRFRGPDVLHRLHDCLLLVARRDADLFTHRGRINLETLASPEAAAYRPHRHDATLQLAYERAEDVDVYDGDVFAWPAEAPPELVVRRLSHDHPAACLRDYDRALAHYGITDEQLGKEWARSA